MAIKPTGFTDWWTSRLCALAAAYFTVPSSWLWKVPALWLPLMNRFRRQFEKAWIRSGYMIVRRGIGYCDCRNRKKALTIPMIHSQSLLTHQMHKMTMKIRNQMIDRVPTSPWKILIVLEVWLFSTVFTEGHWWLPYLIQGSYRSWKSLERFWKFSRPWKVWKMIIGMEKYGKILEKYGNNHW